MVVATAKPLALVYIDGVVDGSIPAGKYLRQMVERHKTDLVTGPGRGLTFDQESAERAIQFFGFLKHSKGEWAGQPFELAPWQAFIVWSLFGWKRADGTRRFRNVYVEVPRKNGKTTLAAGVGLYLFIADGEAGAEVYTAATKRDQARISHGEAMRMVKATPALAKRIKSFRDNLNIPDTASKFEPLGADADTADGLNIHGSIIDELHAHKTRAMVDVLQTAMGARRQPMQFEITTAGYDRESVCWEHHEYSERVLSGSIEDDSWFAFVATIDEGDDWQDPDVWAKANPNYGVSVKPEYLADEAQKAKEMPTALNAFLRLHLDVWTQQSDRWIPLELWDEQAGTVNEEALRGRVCYAGLDLGSVSDMTAWAMVFPTPEDLDEIQVVCRFWCPEARLYDSSNRYRDQYQAWARAGYLLTTPGDATDYGFIKRTILEDARSFNLVDLNLDRLFEGHQVAIDLKDEGLEVYPMGQGFLSMAVPMKEFERRLLARKIHHGGNPVLRWMADNVAVRQDPAGNLKPDKSESQGKIDGIVALVMAIDRAMRAEQGGPLELHFLDW